MARDGADPGGREEDAMTCSTCELPVASTLGPRLNDRDRELVRHLAQGRSTAQIAAAMSVSTNTARTRIRRVEGKLAVSGRHEVVRAARMHGIF
jgi:DNA-binding CsgD family transcriptional regulator